MKTDRPVPAFYHPELDTLRFFAFLMVFARHALPARPEFFAAFVSPALTRWCSAAVDAGAFGVDLFFALSSFLITELLVREVRATGRLDVLSFYVRRALRIWPLYFGMLAVCTVVVPRFFPGKGLPARHVPAFLTFLGNWSCAAFGFPQTPADILWSVSVEEQFYISWPLLLLLFGVRRVALLAVLLMVVANATRVYLISHGVRGDAVWCNTFARLDPIACGALLAVVLRGRSPRLAPAVRVFLILSAATLWVASARYDGRDGRGSLLGLPLAAVAATAVLLASMRAAGGGKVLPYFGKISYGLYVFHTLALLIAGQIVGRSGLAGNLLRIAIALAITFPLAMLSYRFWERPFLKLKARFTHVPSRPDTSL